MQRSQDLRGSETTRPSRNECFLSLVDYPATGHERTHGIERILHILQTPGHDLALLALAAPLPPHRLFEHALEVAVPASQATYTVVDIGFDAFHLESTRLE